jgi:hypothetical protein
MCLVCVCVCACGCVCRVLVVDMPFVHVVRSFPLFELCVMICLLTFVLFSLLVGPSVTTPSTKQVYCQIVIFFKKKNTRCIFKFNSAKNENRTLAKNSDVDGRRARGAIRPSQMRRCVVRVIALSLVCSLVRVLVCLFACAIDINDFAFFVSID